MHTNGTSSTARPRPRPPRREFMTTTCTEDLGRYAGAGLTLEQVIEEELRNVRAAAPARPEESDDLVIWERNKIAALIRIGADGRPVVTRYDRAAMPRTALESETGAGAASEAPDPAISGRGLSPSESAVSETRAAIARFDALGRIAEEVRQHGQQVSRCGASLARRDAGQEFSQGCQRVARELLVISQLHLCHAIDMLSGTVRNETHRRDAGSRASRCGVILGGRLYLVVDDPAGESLVVVDLKHTFQLDPGEGGVSTAYP
jgi:hypothetical protein